MKVVDTAGPRARRVLWRRLVFAVLIGLTVIAASSQAYRILATNGFGFLEWAMFALFVVLMVPIALGFWTAVFGFVVQLRGRDELALSRELAGPIKVDLSAVRTAVVVPAYNEEPVRLFGGLRAVYESVERSGYLQHFDFFVLSDTTDADLWVREEMAFHDLRRHVTDPDRLHYRNRRENVDRKAGNIADFCRQWGGQYRYMIVLDADSVMTGPTLVNLVRLMELHPHVGIVQTPPVAVNRQSLFGRVLQFATRAYGPMFIRGLNFWQAGEGNYWGHNAIIRVEPFVEHCRLPRLPGKPPLGGAILSHDFVEAALMRRAGWKVYLASDLRGSYEEIPANLIGHAARDRRWCQGNLQHSRLLLMPGLNWVSRLHLSMGVMAYVSSPLWMLLLALTTVEGVRLNWIKHQYFLPQQSLFPVWRISVVNQAIVLFTSVMSMLVLPKVLSLVGLLVKGRRAVAGFGGALKLTASVLAETVFSILLAPVLAALHSRFVIGTLLGRKVEWAPQDRGDVETEYSEALRRHAGFTLLGFAWSALLLVEDRVLLWWLTPVLAGLILSIPLSVWSGRVRVGQWARLHGLFVTPEEVRRPFVLRRLELAQQEACRQPWAEPRDGLAWVLQDAEARAVHLGQLSSTSEPRDPLSQHRLEGLKLKLRAKGEAALLAQEKRELLQDPEAIQELAADPPLAPAKSAG